MRKLVGVIWVNLLLFLLVGCDSKPKGPSYQAVEGSGDPVSVRWDFSQAVKHDYRFDQLTDFHLGSIAGATREKNKIKGDCLVSSEGDSLADLKIANLKIDKSESTEVGMKHGAAQTEEVILAGMHEDGAFSTQKELEHLALATVFKLPDAPIAEGATEVTDLELPMNWNNGPGKLRGKQATSFVGYYEIYGVNCIHLESKYEYYEFVSDSGDVSSSKLMNVKGTSSIYFDQESNRIHRSVSECNIKFDMGLASADQTVKITLHKI